MKDHDRRIEKLRALCDEADHLRKSAEQLCRHLSAELDEFLQTHTRLQTSVPGRKTRRPKKR